MMPSSQFDDITARAKRLQEQFDSGVTRYSPLVSVTSNGNSNGSKPRVQYGNVGALLAGEIPPAPIPEILARQDGTGLFYPGQVNMLFGDPETGKTFVALAAIVESINAGCKAAMLDLDHNGMESIVSRLIDMGRSEEHTSELQSRGHLVCRLLL